MAKIQFRKATAEDIPSIWKIISQSIERRRKDGSTQWQDGYPNPNTIKNDIAKGIGYILAEKNTIIGYSSVIENEEPSYDTIEGKWLSNGNFLVVHRIAISEEFLGKGYAQRIFGEVEQLAKQKNIPSIKVDTNFDNGAMLRILEKLGYIYCGEITLQRNGDKRMAFEKLLNN